MGRPRSDDKRTHAIQVRLNDEENALFERLLEARQAELRSEGVEVTPPVLLRWLIYREAAARGLDKPPPTASPPPNAPAKTRRR